MHEMLFGSQIGLVRVNSSRSVNPIMSFGEWDCRSQMIGPCRPADRQDCGDPSVTRAPKHSVAVLIELRIFKMRVGVDDVQGRSSSAGVSAGILRLHF